MKTTSAKILWAVCAAAMLASIARAQTNHYVSPDGGNTSPYTNWATAARNIQDAIAASADGAVIWVTNGVYNTGGTWYDNLTNRVYINKAIRVESVNGPSNTAIVGRWHNPGVAEYGDGAVRCVYMADNASLVGFTLTNGSTRIGAGNENYARGGGAASASSSAAISNCVIAGNRASRYGAGAHNCSLYNSRVEGNISAYGAGGAMGSVLYNCEIRNNTASGGIGGGMFGTAAYSCTFTGNTGTWGGGMAYGSMYSCLVIGNRATSGSGGGSDNTSVYNSTVIGNSSSGSGAGVSRTANVWNSIVYYNTGDNYSSATFYYSCSPGLAGVNGNITNAPMFVDRHGGNLRLDLGSPCVNAGTNSAWMSNPADARSADADGQPRLRGPLVDMGAYEQYITPGTIFIIRGQ